MTIMLRFILALLLILPLSSWGENILNPLKSTSKEETAPNPLNLSSNWWDYYDVDKTTLEKRKNETEKIFEGIEKNLPEDDRVKAQALSNKFISGLQTIIDLKGEIAPIASYVATFPEKYTFQEWLDLGQFWLQNQRELEEREFKNNLLQFSVRSNSQQLNTFFAAYLTGKKEEQSVHLFKSLEIMNMKVNLVIDQIKLANLNADVEVQKDKLKQIEKEIQYSKNHIDFATGNLAEIIEQIAQVKARLQESEGEVLDLSQLAINQPSLSKNIGEQKVVEHSVARIKNQILLINLELQKMILELGLRKTKIESTAAERDKIDQIAKEAKNWKNKTELMFEQALKNPTLLSKSQESAQEKQLFEQFLRNTESIILDIQQIENQVFISRFLMDEVHALKKQMPTTLRGFFIFLYEGSANLFTLHAKWFKESLFKIGDIPVTPLGILKVIFIILIAVLIGKFLKASVHRFGKKHQLMKTSSLYILSRLIYYFILVIGFIVAGASLGFDLTAFAYIAGAITVWIGFGLQSIFTNFISGIIILLTKNLNVGDIIVLDSGEVGQIVEITLRTTILATTDGVEVVIPNSDLVTKKFTNRTLAKNSRRINVAFRIPLGENKPLIKKILVEAVLQAPITLPQPEPEIWFMGYGENHIKCEMAIWVNEFLSPLPNMSTNAYYFNLIDDALRAHHIEIPIIPTLPIH